MLGLSATVFYFYRNWFRRFVTGFPDSHMEIDSREKVVNELMDREIFHELNAENKYHSTTVKLGELSAGSVRTSAVADMLKRSSSPGELSADSMGGSTLGNTPASTPGETCPDSEGLKWPEKHSNKEGAWF